MKSKEALQFIIDTFNQYANKPNDIGLFFKFCEAHEQVKKDLEALEKIKKNFDIWVYKDEINIQANIGGEIARKKFKEKDIEFFEEWLDE